MRGLRAKVSRPLSSTILLPLLVFLSSCAMVVYERPYRTVATLPSDVSERTLYRTTLDTRPAAAPAIDNKNIFVPTQDGYLNVLNRTTGALIRKIKLADSTYVSPVVTDNFVCVVIHQFIYAYDKNRGTAQWIFKGASEITTQPVAQEGFLYVTTGKLLLSVQAKTGQEQWRQSVDQPITSEPALSEGKVFLSTQDTLYAFNAKTGNPVWTYKTEGSRLISPPRAQEGLVYVYVSGKRGLQVLNANTGQPVWKTNLYDYAHSAPVVEADGYVFVTDERGSVQGISPSTQEVAWKSKLDRYLEFQPMVIEDGPDVYIPISERLLALNPHTGETRWTLRLSEPIIFAPAGHQGTLYVMSGAHLYAIDTSK